MDLSYLAEMTISEETQFLTVFEQQLEHDVGEAANARQQQKQVLLLPGVYDNSVSMEF